MAARRAGWIGRGGACGAGEDTGGAARGGSARKSTTAGLGSSRTAGAGAGSSTCARSRWTVGSSSPSVNAVRQSRLADCSKESRSNVGHWTPARSVVTGAGSVGAAVATGSSNAGSSEELLDIARSTARTRRSVVRGQDNVLTFWSASRSDTSRGLSVTDSATTSAGVSTARLRSRATASTARSASPRSRTSRCAAAAHSAHPGVSTGSTGITFRSWDTNAALSAALPDMTSTSRSVASNSIRSTDDTAPGILSGPLRLHPPCRPTRSPLDPSPGMSRGSRL